MTWVVGASSVIGYGLMLSDVRISFSDGSQADLLRKSYPISPFILAGFAGSVQIGMALIESMQKFLEVPEMDGDHAWQPEWVAENWSPIAADLFRRASPMEQSLGSQIMMVGVSPDENMGGPGFQRVYVTKFNWPDFVPVHMEKGAGVSHIGSGSNVEDYKRGIAEFFEFGSSAMLAGLRGGPAGWGQMVGGAIARVVNKTPVPGISPHVFIDVCNLGYLWQGTNDENVHYPDGRRVEFRMPEVATSYGDFIVRCQKIGKGAASAVA